MAHINSLVKINFEDLYHAFNKAFFDYEIQLNKDELYKMLQRRGFNPELSFGAFVNDQLVSFTFNGIGAFNGIKTAYDTGTGTIKKFRGQGHATKIFQYAMPFLRKNGVSQYLLEVLQHNKKAVSIYSKLGFEVRREFNYFTKNRADIRFCPKPAEKGYQIKQIELAQLHNPNNFMDFSPSWQNSFDAVFRKPEYFKFIGAFKEKVMIGYCILEPASGDITQIAVARAHRRKGVGTQLLKATLKYNQRNLVKVLNTDVNCTSITAFLKANSFPVSGKQFEMTKYL